MLNGFRYQDGLVVAVCLVVGWALESRQVVEQGFAGYATALAICGLVGGYVTRSRLVAPAALWLGQVLALLFLRPPMWGVSLVVVTAAISLAVLTAVAGTAARRAATRGA